MTRLPSHQGPRVADVGSARSSHCSVQGLWVLLIEHPALAVSLLKQLFCQSKGARLGIADPWFRFQLSPHRLLGQGTAWGGRGLASLLILTVLE